MIITMMALQNEWKYARGIVMDFLENLSASDLHKEFPRKNLNSIMKQCNELYEIQQDYVDAIEKRSMEFKGRNLNIDSSVELIYKMQEIDKKLEEYMESLDGNEIVEWFGEKMDIHQHICAMISHENMHIGQIIAFCYATGINIPECIIEKMSLDG